VHRYFFSENSDEKYGMERKKLMVFSRIFRILLLLCFIKRNSILASQVTNVQGHWTIVDYPQHPECIDVHFEITRDGQNQNIYHLHAQVVNSINSDLEYNPVTNEWKAGPVASTKMLGSPKEMKKEHIVISLISNIRKMKVRDGKLLIIKTNGGERIQLARVQ
jgi:hypothetical protein